MIDGRMPRRALGRMPHRAFSRIGEFQRRFEEIHGAAPELETAWQLGGAAADYLRKHPGSIHVPDALPQMLLGSECIDARVVGLKLLTRLNSPPEVLVPAICAALRSTHDEIVYGGLFELDALLEREEPLMARVLVEIRDRLSVLADSPDSYLRSTALRYLEQLDHSAPPT